ncbi:receptor-transporting protein 3-like [Halichoeres trimaculatus]|uniref:receptor-transporting protein 3-like n=1 Tax=Halichoeres trimaculatus TaxID=147232 RepID=UPI003D9E7191
MSFLDWTSIFESKASELEEGHTWRLEFDNSLEPDNPNKGWQQYIKNTSAWFKCSKCGRGWPSNRVMVVFHMRLKNRKGIVKVRRFRQNCKKCKTAPMEKPSIDLDNIDSLMESLVVKIRIKCYREDLGDSYRGFRRWQVRNPHEPDHCEACIEGICTQEKSVK